MYGMLKHPKIIRLYGYYSKNSRLHLVLELGRQDLRSYLNEQTGEGLPFSKAVAFSQDIAEGLTFLHGKDIIHLDIKSSNVIMCQGDVVKITDFGTARKMIGTDTQSTLGKSGRGRWGQFVFFCEGVVCLLRQQIVRTSDYDGCVFVQPSLDGT